MRGIVELMLDKQSWQLARGCSCISWLLEACCSVEASRRRQRCTSSSQQGLDALAECREGLSSVGSGFGCHVFLFLRLNPPYFRTWLDHPAVQLKPLFDLDFGCDAGRTAIVTHRALRSLHSALAP